MKRFLLTVVVAAMLNSELWYLTFLPLEGAFQFKFMTCTQYNWATTKVYGKNAAKSSYMTNFTSCHPLLNDRLEPLPKNGDQTRCHLFEPYGSVSQRSVTFLL